MRTFQTLLLVALALGACGTAVAPPTDTPISPAELAQRLTEGTAPVVLDVRSRQEFEEGHIPGAVNIPHDELATRIAELPAEKSRELVVHCRSGRRAELAEATLREHGYENLRDLTGHWLAWQEAELPVE